MQQSDELIFAPDKEPKPKPTSFWKVLVVDDDELIHELTNLALQTFECKGKGLELCHTYSAAETLEYLKIHSDVAVILLDVVMETRNAGLDIVSEIREINKHVRIIIRTGQPGSVPEREIVVKYDIDDYKEKSELTAQKLFTTMISALRTYDRIMEIEDICIGLGQLSEERNVELLRVNSLIEILRRVLADSTTSMELLPQFESALTHILNHYGDAAQKACIFLTDKKGKAQLKAQKCTEEQALCPAGTCFCEEIKEQNSGLMYGVGKLEGRELHHISVPIRSQGSAIGVLNVFFTHYTEDEVKFVNLISYALSSMCEKQKLTEIIGNLNYLDLTTKLPNKVKFTELVEDEKWGDPFFLVKITVTNLEEVARSEGLSGCDEALIKCADALTSVGKIVGQLDRNVFAVVCKKKVKEKIVTQMQNLIQGQTAIHAEIQSVKSKKTDDKVSSLLASMEKL